MSGAGRRLQAPESGPDLVLPEGLLPDPEMDEVLHRLLIGPATSMPGRRAIVDHGREVPRYSDCIDDALRLARSRLQGSEITLRLGGNGDAAVLCAEGLGIRASGQAGQGALALSLLILAAAHGIDGQEAWEAMIADMVRLMKDREARRAIRRI